MNMAASIPVLAPLYPSVYCCPQSTQNTVKETYKLVISQNARDRLSPGVSAPGLRAGAAPVGGTLALEPPLQDTHCNIFCLVVSLKSGGILVHLRKTQRGQSTVLRVHG